MASLKVQSVTIWAWFSTLIAVAGVGCLLLFVLIQGGPSLGKELLFGEAEPLQAITGQVPIWDGIWPALVGTLVLVLLSVVLALPCGLGCGIYLALFARGPLQSILTFGVNLLAGIPSIIMGLFGFSLILFLRRTFVPSANTCLLLAAGCLGCLILPYIIRATQNGLSSLSPEQRLIGPSLGLNHFQNLVHVLLPQASKSILSGVILAVGRAAEDTAVILLTGVVANSGLPRGLTGKFEALPFNIYYLASEFRSQEELQAGFGTCIVLLTLTTGLFITAHLIQRHLDHICYNGN